MDEPPLTLAEGGVIRRGYSAELDELHDASRNAPPVGRRSGAHASASGRGIATLKVGYNKVFGYYLEVTNSQLGARARRLHPQADADHRRALHHARPEGVRGADPQRAGEDRQAGAGAVRGAARGDRGAVGARPCCGRRGRWRSWTWCWRWRRWRSRNSYCRPELDEGDAHPHRRGAASGGGGRASARRRSCPTTPRLRPATRRSCC